MTLAALPTPTSSTEADRTELEPASDPFIRMPARHRMAALAVLISYCALMVLLGAPTADAENGFVMASVTVYLAMLAVPFLLYRGSFGWLHPLVVTSIIAFLSLARSFPAHAWGLSRHIALPALDPPHLNELLAYKMALTALGHACLLIGYAVTPGLWAPRIRTRPWPGLLTRTTAIVLVSAVACFVYIQGRGGILSFVVALGKSRHDALSGQMYFLYPAQLGAVACILCLAARPNVVKNPWFWALVAVGCSLEPLLTFSRSTLVFAAFCLLFAYALSVGRMPIGRGAIMAVLAVYVVTALGDLRASTWQNRLDRGASENEGFQDTLSRGWTDQFVERATTADGMIPILARVPSEVDFLYGESYLAVFAMPIPRTLWKEKPTLVGGRVGRVFYHTRAGIPPGAVGEAFWNLHIPGIMLVHLLGGVFLRFMARMRELNPTDPLACALLVVLIFNSSPTTDSAVMLLLRVSELLLCALVLLRPVGRRATTDLGVLVQGRGTR